MRRLAGKTALVTGATSGVGRAVAERGWTTLARPPAPILADLTSSTFAERQKESTWL